MISVEKLPYLGQVADERHRKLTKNSLRLTAVTCTHKAALHYIIDNTIIRLDISVMNMQNKYHAIHIFSVSLGTSPKS